MIRIVFSVIQRKIKLDFNAFFSQSPRKKVCLVIISWLNHAAQKLEASKPKFIRVSRTFNASREEKF